MNCIEILQKKVSIRTIIISDAKDKQTRDRIMTLSEKRAFFVPNSGFLSALLCLFPLQRLAYDITIALGYDPDRPRNLAKELTTK